MRAVAVGFFFIETASAFFHRFAATRAFLFHKSELINYDYELYYGIQMFFFCWLEEQEFEPQFTAFR